jgi:hypothetical protein
MDESLALGNRPGKSRVYALTATSAAGKVTHLSREIRSKA